MKEKIYIENILNGDEDFEGGLLSNLNVDPPKNVHDIVMRNIRTKETKLMKRFNFKKYLSVAAAIVIFVSGVGRVAYVGLQKDKEVNITAQNEVKQETEIQTEDNKLAVAFENTQQEKQSNNIQTNAKDTGKKTNQVATTKEVKTNEVQQRKSSETKEQSETTKTTVAIAQQDNANSTSQHKENVLNTLSQGNISYEYEIYYSNEDIALIDYLNTNALKISDELFSFNLEQFEEFKKYVEENNIELKSININQDKDAIEIVIRLIKK